MSKYTTELRYICESLTGLDESVGNNKTEEIINKARPLIFNFNFPIFEEGYEVGLEKKIIDHFYFREIGYETYGLWQNRLRMKLNEIMPYYNKLYLTEEFEYDPLGSLDYTVIHEGEYEDFNQLDKTGRDTDNLTSNDTERKTGDETLTKSGSDTNAKTGSDTKSKSGSDTESVTGTDTDTHSGIDARTFGTDEYHGDSWTLFSDTPQGGLDGIQNATDDVKANAYLTNATRNILDYNDSNTDNMEYGHTIDHEHDTSTEIEYNSSEEVEYDSQNTLTYDTTEEKEFNTTVTNRKDSTLEKIKNTSDISNGRGIQNWIEKFKGRKDVDPNKMLKEYRDNLLNIDMMIIDELEDLFLKLW